jgi:hypothetical protein
MDRLEEKPFGRQHPNPWGAVNTSLAALRRPCIGMCGVGLTAASLLTAKWPYLFKFLFRRIFNV